MLPCDLCAFMSFMKYKSHKRRYSQNKTSLICFLYFIIYDNSGKCCYYFFPLSEIFFSEAKLRVRKEVAKNTDFCSAFCLHFQQAQNNINLGYTYIVYMYIYMSDKNVKGTWSLYIPTLGVGVSPD